MNRALPTLLLILTSIGAAMAAPTVSTDKSLTPFGAKGMFYEQINRPAEKLNNGVQYWIELKRNGVTKRVSNKFAFKSGDEIRFHVKSNTDAFAYVILREGSRGEKSVLFPDPRHADDNRMKANVEYNIPGDSYLMFDQFPGTERVTLVTSRTPVEPNKFVPDNFRDKVIVASRVDGSKDLIPGSFVMSVGGPSASETALASNPLPSSTTLPASNPLPTSSTVSSPPASNGSSRPQQSSPIQHADFQDAPDEQSIITVVQKNPAEALAVDICLEHKP